MMVVVYAQLKFHFIVDLFERTIGLYVSVRREPISGGLAFGFIRSSICFA